MKFIHLHTHSHYSLLDGLSRIDDIVSAAVNAGAPAIALTDHGNMYGAIEFYKKAKKAGIKPIIGVEAYLAARTLYDKTPRIDAHSYHITLFARNNEGYKNLMKLVSKANLEGFYYKPRIDLDALREHHEGILALSGCLNGMVSRTLLSGDYEGAKKRAYELQDIFGKDNFYLEINHHPGIADAEKIYPALLQLVKETGIPPVAAQDAHYPHAGDAHVHDVFLAIQTGNKTDDDDRLTMKNTNFSLIGEEEMLKKIPEIPEAVYNTMEVAEKCNVEIELGKTKIPPYPIGKGETHNGVLRVFAEKGLKSRGLDKDEEAKKRLEYELSVIDTTGFASYFLIVQDFINFAKSKGIQVGPGRGSGAGSLAAYSLGITEVDPLRHNLLFERFLNPERISMPDFDTDFSDTRREEVFVYLKEKYGKNSVAQIITFGTMAARAAVRDAGRALGLAYQFCDTIAKLIPAQFDLKQSLETIPELEKMRKSDKDAKELLDVAQRIEGTIRHASVHASAVVVTPGDMTDYCPVQFAPQDNSRIITQYDMYAIEDLGLLKIDALGLRTLSEMETAYDLVNTRRHETVTIVENDPRAYQLFSKGDTVGVFQFESRGMREYMRQLRPENINDVTAMVSLYRPGPMELIPQYIKRKHKIEKAQYLHPSFEKVLKETHGIMVYQEQLMRIAQVSAGFTLGEADVLRKAVGKKIKELLDQQRDKLINKMVQQGIDKKIAVQFWELVEPFARYAFNKSHAVCYATVAYQTAYVKAHYPVEFLTALLIHEGKDLDRAKIIIEDAKKHSIAVLPPDVNESGANFTVVDDKTIRFGLGAIKNVGEKLVEAIEEERIKNGKFSSVENLLQRIHNRDLNRKSLESLVRSGALDSLGERDALYTNLDELVAYGQRQKNGIFATARLFEVADNIFMRPAVSLSLTEKLSWEKELLGIYVSGHPFEEAAKQLNGKIKRITDIRRYKDVTRVRIGGVIAGLKRIITKKNHQMITMELEDLSDTIRIIFFPKTYSKLKSVPENGKIVVISGDYDPKRGEMIGEDLAFLR